MKKVFRKNQIIITALALMIAVAGYINYSDNIKNRLKKTSAKETAQTTEAVETDPVSGDILSNDAEPDDSLEDPGAMVFTSNLSSQFIINAKLDREQVRASDKENLLSVIDNEALSEDEKASAVNKMVELTNASEREAAAELLLSAKGFDNVIVSITGEQADVVIEKDELTPAELAQIEDVVKRKTECPIENITITTVTPVKDDENSPVSGEAETASETETETDADAAAETSGVQTETIAEEETGVLN